MQTISAATITTGSALVAAIVATPDCRATVTDVSPELRESLSAFLDDSAQLDDCEDVWGTDDDGTEFRAYLVAAE